MTHIYYINIHSLIICYIYTNLHYITYTKQSTFQHQEIQQNIFHVLKIIMTCTKSDQIN